MRKLGIFIVVGTLAVGLVAFAGCSSSNSSGSNGTGASTAATTSSSGSPTGSTGPTTGPSGSGGSTGTGGAGGFGGSEGAGGASANFICTIPSPIPSNGSCVTFVSSDAGEVDAGVDMNGDATITTCDPVTNAGCDGTDVCGPDAANANYFCQPAGSPSNLPICGDCSSDTATCGPGGLCILVNSEGTLGFCAQMCCTDEDCGGTSGSCQTMLLQPALPQNVGLCAPPGM